MSVGRFNRLKISFFFDTQSVTDIVKSPIMVWNILTDFGKVLDNGIIESLKAVGGIPYNARDKTHFFYYTFKNIPVINQILSFNGFFPVHKEPRGPLVQFLEASDFFMGVEGIGGARR